METTRIKVKVGGHEFEAEGPTEIVQSQFETFKQLIASSPKVNENTKRPDIQGETRKDSLSGININAIYRVDGRIVSLTVKPEAEATAAMLIMLGQKASRENETVTASEIKDGLEQSGYRPGRIDRLMLPLSDEGSVIKIGARKGTRYRFTNQGLAKAVKLASEAVAEVA